MLSLLSSLYECHSSNERLKNITVIIEEGNKRRLNKMAENKTGSIRGTVKDETKLVIQGHVTDRTNQKNEEKKEK